MNTTFRVLNTTFRVPNTNFRVLNTTLRLRNTKIRVINYNYRVPNTNFRVPNTIYGYLSLNDQLRNSKCLIINTMRSPFLFLYILCASAVACGKPLRVRSK
ncbi:hypothetical protein [uncultured Nostoc sp.]|uniref:hypothetical protein n=1 Tax=uncultured Nostoc sp. TaxID=340711 RepID=UPI002607538A|nr:hypothetical protein [uncultured Nostoc sp.]